MAIIGIVGFAGSGKDEAANRLKAHLQCATNGEWRIVPFAKPLKEGIGKGVFGFTDQQLYGDAKELVDPFWGFSPRWTLQFCGTDMFRAMMGLDFWVKCLLKSYRGEPAGTHYLVPDVRFPNEAEAIRHEGGRLIRVTGRHHEVQHGIVGHESEAHAKTLPYDHELVNDGSLQDLDDAVAELAPILIKEIGREPKSP